MVYVLDEMWSNWWMWIAAGVSASLGVMLIRRLVAGKECRSGESMIGKTVVVTGASSGIGKATAMELAKRGARVIMACRDVCKAEKAVRDIHRHTSCGQLIVLKLDLASLQSVRDFAARICQEEEYIHVLINNAGVYGHPYTLTEDGLEMNMAVNHFGHFLLVHLLLEKLKASGYHTVLVIAYTFLFAVNSINDNCRCSWPHCTYNAVIGTVGQFLCIFFTCPQKT